MDEVIHLVEASRKCLLTLNQWNKSDEVLYVGMVRDAAREKKEKE